MANSDRTSEVYEDERPGEHEPRVAQDRVHWFADQARGHVLDIGCSQGAVSIRCAHRGLITLGVDIDTERVDHALAERAREPQHVRERLAFRVADATALDLPNATFDTVLLCGVIEHYQDPAPIVAEVARVLRPGGRLALTAPLGYRPGRTAFFLGSLVGLLAPHVTVDTLDIEGGFFWVVARPGAMPEADRRRLVVDLQPAFEAAVLQVQRRVHEEWATATERLRRTEIRAARVDEVNTRLKNAEERLRRQIHRTEYASWKLRVARTGRWWRLGAALNAARRPSGLIRVPFEVARAMRKVPRPAEPASPQAAVDPDLAGHFVNLTLPSSELPDGPVARKDLTVAVILDRFSAAAFRYEWNQIEFGPGDWREVLERDRPDLLFVESAWWGNGGRWNQAMSSGDAPHRALRELVGWCRERSIPTVFWNKEDPPNYGRFIATARLFDRVFTVDADCLPRYRKDLGHDRVGLLPFGAQPRIHNPVSVPGGRQYDVAFAGTYHNRKYPERATQMEALLDPALEFDLHIFSRNADDPDFAFPPRYAEHIVGSLPYERMVAAYKAYKIFLNVNSVTNSPTMCARRVFELSACATPVVSGHSRALEKVFGDLVRLSRSAEETTAALIELMKDAELRDRLGHRAMREVFARHTFGHRVDTVLDSVGLPAPRRDRPVSVLLPTNRPEQVSRAIEQVARQGHRPLQLVLILHNIDVDPQVVEDKARSAGIEDVVVRTADSTHTLGACLNLGIDAADGAYLAKMDDDNIYGEHYLSDLMTAFDYTDAAVVGKGAHYVQLQATGATILRFPHLEHAAAELIQGGTIVADGELLRRLRFGDLPRAVDSDLLRRVVAEQAGVYSADRFNFVSVRGVDPNTHTWKITDEELMRSGRVVFHGEPSENVLF